METYFDRIFFGQNKTEILIKIRFSWICSTCCVGLGQFRKLKSMKICDVENSIFSRRNNTFILIQANSGEWFSYF